MKFFSVDYLLLFTKFLLDYLSKTKGFESIDPNVTVSIWFLLMLSLSFWLRLLSIYFNFNRRSFLHYNTTF